MVRFFVRFYPILLALFLAAAIFLARANAFAADVSGQACSNLGTTQMTADRTGLVFCALKEGKESASQISCEENGGCVWKSMTDKAGSGVPVGAIIAWPVEDNPDDMQNGDGTLNWLDCNGQAITAARYPELYKKVGGRVPNLSGLFLRGIGAQASNHYGNTLHQSGSLGEAQGDTIRDIHAGLDGIASAYEDSWPGASGAMYYTQGSRIYHSNGEAPKGRTMHLHFSASRAVPVANENRPVNMAVRYLIRARP